MLSNPSQVLVRNHTLFEEGRWLLINAPDSAIFRELSSYDIRGFHQFYPVYDAIPSADKEQHVFSHQYPDATFNGIVIYMPKAKAHLAMLIAQAQALLVEGGTLALVGDNKSGAKSGGKVLSQHTDNCYKLDAARHCSLFIGISTAPPKPFELGEWFKDVNISIGEKAITMRTLPGVFSHGELDSATELLLQNASLNNTEQVLDFACGAGVIGVWLAKYHQAQNVVMSDINALALYCANETATLNHVNAKVVASDGLDQIDGYFDAVVTNPPFHTGVKTDYAISEQFIQRLPGILKPNGELLLVANRFLPYPEQIARAIKQPKTLAQTNKFNLYYCQR